MHTKGITAALAVATLALTGCGGQSATPSTYSTAGVKAAEQQLTTNVQTHHYAAVWSEITADALLPITTGQDVATPQATRLPQHIVTSSAISQYLTPGITYVADATQLGLPPSNVEIKANISQRNWAVVSFQPKNHRCTFTQADGQISQNCGWMRFVYVGGRWQFNDLIGYTR